MSQDDSRVEDGVSRSIEAAQMVKIFVNLFDEMKLRKFSKHESLEIAENFLDLVMGYKASMQMMDQQNQMGEGQIIFLPEGGPDGPHSPGCSHA